MVENVCTAFALRNPLQLQSKQLCSHCVKCEEQQHLRAGLPIPSSGSCAARHTSRCASTTRCRSAQVPRTCGSLKAAPRAARSALSLYASQQPGSRKAPCQPSASAVRISVPCHVASAKVFCNELFEAKHSTACVGKQGPRRACRPTVAPQCPADLGITYQRSGARHRQGAARTALLQHTQSCCRLTRLPGSWMPSRTSNRCSEGSATNSAAVGASTSAVTCKPDGITSGLEPPHTLPSRDELQP